MALSTQQQLLVEQRLSNERKSVGVAYLLWLFLGAFGAHRFYLGQPLTATVALVLFVGGWTLWIGSGGQGALGMAGASMVFGWAVLMLLDAVQIPGMTQEDIKRKRLQIADEVSRNTSA